MMSAAILAALIFCLLIVAYDCGRAGARRELLELPDNNGVCGPQYIGDDFYYLVPMWRWIEVEDFVRFAAKPCTRDAGHDGPCNGWPCQEAAERMRAE